MSFLACREVFFPAGFQVYICVFVIQCSCSVRYCAQNLLIYCLIKHLSLFAIGIYQFFLDNNVLPNTSNFISTHAYDIFSLNTKSFLSSTSMTNIGQLMCAVMFPSTALVTHDHRQHSLRFIPTQIYVAPYHSHPSCCHISSINFFH